MASLNLLNLKGRIPPTKEKDDGGKEEASRNPEATEGARTEQPDATQTTDQASGGAGSGGLGTNPDTDSQRDDSTGASDRVGDSVPDTGSVQPAKSLLGGLKLNKPASAGVTPTPTPAAGTSVDSLAALSADESTGVQSSGISSFVYEDEIPATAPERQLPEDMTEEMEGFVKSLDGIYSVMSDPELFGQMIRHIMMELQQNPQYAKLLADDDVAAMIRGMRESMGLARMKKVEGKAKRAGTGAAKAKKADAKNDAILGDLSALAADMGLSFD